MIVILGLIILVAAVAIGVAGVAANAGSAHELTHPLAVFGYHVTGSTGALFLSGMVVGAAGMLGLGLLLAGARRTSRRGSDARAGLKQSREDQAAAATGSNDLPDRQTTPSVPAAIPAATPTPVPTQTAAPAPVAAVPDASETDRQGVAGGRRGWPNNPFGHRTAPH
jgi:hypothetical protein